MVTSLLVTVNYTDKIKGTNGATTNGRLSLILDKHTIHGQGPSGPE